MKSVILFRHGKSNCDIDYGLDHERPLSNKGTRDAKTMGKYLAKLNQIPDLVISSTALRAKTTAELSIKEGGWKSKFILEKRIYQSLPEDLLNILKLLKDDKNIVCLTGHEPTFSSFILVSFLIDFLSTKNKISILLASKSYKLKLVPRRPKKTIKELMRPPN